MKTKRRRASLPSITCPHCQSVAAIRTSESVSELLRQLRFRCENDECGHVFAADLVVTRTIVQSACPNPRIQLPFGRTARPANDDARVPANDDRAPAAETAPTPS